MAQLPKTPQGHELEELVVATIQAPGLFFERNIVERDEGEEVLELDAVVTNYNRADRQRYLVEVKSGSWGFSDVFKILGWASYLRISDASIVVSQIPPERRITKQKCTEIGVSLIELSSSPCQELLDHFQIASPPPPHDIEVWRFAFWAERRLLRDLKRLKKHFHQKRRSFRELDEYLFQANSGAFFTKSPYLSIRNLFRNYSRIGNISAKVSNELAGGNFSDASALEVHQEHFNAAYYVGKYTFLDLTTFVEHRARLSLLKAAVDLIFVTNAPAADARLRHRHPSVILSALPENFGAGIEAIRDDEYLHLYPSFWSTFLWEFGAFILLDYQDRDFEALASRTGIPVEAIPRALAIYDLLFPAPGGWFNDLGRRSHISLIKLFPTVFHGVGANLRRLAYTPNKDFDELEVEGEYTRSDLIRWNDCLVEVLNSGLDAAAIA